MKRSELTKIVKEELQKINEAAKPSLMNIQLEARDDVEEFVSKILKISKGYVKTEKDAALLLMQILKNIYKI
jgi:hypothetical protein